MNNRRRTYVTILLWTLAFLVLYVISRHNYLLFHGLAETFSIVVACGIFMIAWNSRQYADNNYLLFIGIAYLFVGGMDMLHVLGYKGMGVFNGYDANLPTQLWIVARYMESLSLCLAPLLIRRKIRARLVMSGYALVFSLALGTIFYCNIFPDCFIEGDGLTIFKKISEYIISLIFLGAIPLMLRERRAFDAASLRLLVASIAMSIASELSFTLYTNVYGLPNAMGHFLKVISFALIYKAIIKTGLENPYRILFRNLKQSEERFRSLVTGAPVGIFETDAEGDYLFVNPRWYEIAGMPADAALGKGWANGLYIEDRERVSKEWYEVARLGGEFALEYRFQIPGGKITWVLGSATALQDETGTTTGYLGTILDITERKRREEEMLKVEKLESVGVLAGGIAHDFNNLLTGIMGNISLAEMYAQAGNPMAKVLERLKEAERASMRARDLTQQLLTFSKGGAPIRKTASMSKLLRDSATLASSGSNIRCEFSISDDLWSVDMDEGQMNQVISNIIINANQAMAGGGTVKVHAGNTTVKAEHGLPLADGKYVKVSIEDHGVGIPEADLPKIFDPYFTTKQTGSGLGLAICYSILEKHGGYITADSQPGVGTTFHIYLPASQEEASVKVESRKEKPITGNGNILLMDDEEIVRELASSMMDSLGYEVTVAVDGTETVELYKKAMESGNPFDAVITDLTIPGGMGGRETIKKLMEIDPEVKAIVSSGYSNNPIMINFREYGFNGVIAKPYKANELGEVLNKVITNVD